MEFESFSTEPSCPKCGGFNIDRNYRRSGAFWNPFTRETTPYDEHIDCKCWDCNYQFSMETLPGKDGGQ